VSDEFGAAGGPTLLVPLRNLLEQASASVEVKHLAGEVQSFEELLRPENLDRLADASPGVLAFLAFHVGADTTITEYVKAGSLASDSGRKVLVLFSSDTRVFSPTYSDDASVFSGADAIPGVKIDAGIQPAYEMIRLLFEPDPAPPLPGIALFKDFTDSEVVYAKLSGLATPGEVAERLRQIFALAAEAGALASDRTFAEAVSVGLEKRRIPHLTTGRTSVREWFVRGYQFLWDNRSDIIAGIGAVV
jgi:hypothetical protein